jgi:carbon monoxide dehydrogenase subunit G
MLIQNTLTVPATIDETWGALLDVPLMARCFPGAALTEVVDERTFRGTVAIALGPVRLTFGGEAVITEMDRASRLLVVQAKGNDKSGRGTARAKLTCRLTQVSQQSTRVDLETDLSLGGSVAQYGRAAGLIEELSTELIKEFAGNLEAELVKGRAPQVALVRTISPESARNESAARAAPRQISGFRVLVRAILAVLRRRLGRGRAYEEAAK